MTRMEHLLTILSEECSEVSQRVTKALRFGLHEVQPGQELTNAQRILRELEDLTAAVEMLKDEGVFKVEFLDEDRIAGKKERVEKFLFYSKELGTLTE